MAKPNPKRRAQTKAKIKDAFWSLYKEGSLKSATVSAIIALADIHRSTFYEYYPDSPAVLKDIEDEQIANASSHIKRAMADMPNVDAMETVMAIYGENADTLSVLLREGTGSPFAQRLKQQIIPLVETAFEVNADDGANRYAFEFTLSGILSAITLWYSRGCIEPIDELAETLRALMLKGSYAYISNASAK